MRAWVRAGLKPALIGLAAFALAMGCWHLWEDHQAFHRMLRYVHWHQAATPDGRGK